MLRLFNVAGLVACFVIPQALTQNTDVVQTSYGPIIGEEVTEGGPPYKAFRGIPYAAPPVGDLRFAAPIPPEKWTEVRNATSFGNICLQKKKDWTPPMSEDCLTLNVYTPSLDENSLKPVLFYIHGGAFSSGDGTDRVYGPQYLIEEDIVIVTINYRLGPLGFLTANTSDVSGNWGLKDQVAALKWVQENIAHFGGDPKNVTIYGGSAGAISVHLHMLSPLSNGLFSKAIAASGASTRDSAVRAPEQAVENSKILARRLGAKESDIESPEKMIEFLRTAEGERIVKRARKVADDEDLLFKPMPFVPVIETRGTEGAFITEEPRMLLKEGRFTKVPLMMGTNDLEGGIMFVGLGKKITPKRMRKVEENVCEVLPRDLMEAVTAKSECGKVAEEFRNAYFDGEPFNSSMLNFVYMCGDLRVTLNVHFAQRILALLNKGDPPIYNYYFTFDGKWNMVKKHHTIVLPGATHSDDLAYVFKPSSVSWDPANVSPEAITRNRMVRLVANFVKHGDPTPEVSDLIPIKWEPATEDESKTMVIGNELTLEKEFLKRRMDMWDRLYTEYTGKPLFS